MCAWPCFAFQWKCPVCGWQGEIRIASRWGLHADGCLHVGDTFDPPSGWPARDLLIYETFCCPQCVSSPANCYLAEIRSFGSRIWHISVCDLLNDTEAVSHPLNIAS